MPGSDALAQDWNGKEKKEAQAPLLRAFSE